MRIGRDGKRRPLSSIEGRRSAGELIKARPHTPLRQIAKEAGISLGTAADVRSRVLRGEDPVPQGRTHAPPASAAARRPVSTVTAELPAARAVEPPTQLDVAAMMRILRSDPSLRFSEGGRSLLRWLSGHVIESRESRIARSWSRGWSQESGTGAAGLQDGEYRGQGVRSARQQYGDGDLTAAALGHQHPGPRGAGGQEFAPGHPDRALNGGRPLRGGSVSGSAP